MPQHKSRMVLRFIGLVVLIEFMILALVGILGWRASWQTPVEFGNGMQIAGILVIGIGFMGVKGNWDATRSFGYQYSLSATNQRSWERIQQTLVDFAQSYTFMMVMFFAGGLSLIIGWLM